MGRWNRLERRRTPFPPQWRRLVNRIIRRFHKRRKIDRDFIESVHVELDPDDPLRINVFFPASISSAKLKFEI